MRVRECVRILSTRSQPHANDVRHHGTKNLRLEIETMKVEKLEQDIQVEQIRKDQIKKNKVDTDEGGGRGRRSLASKAL